MSRSKRPSAGLLLGGYLAPQAELVQPLVPVLLLLDVLPYDRLILTDFGIRADRSDLLVTPFCRLDAQLLAVLGDRPASYDQSPARKLPGDFRV